VCIYSIKALPNKVFILLSVYIIMGIIDDNTNSPNAFIQLYDKIRNDVVARLDPASDYKNHASELYSALAEEAFVNESFAKWLGNMPDGDSCPRAFWDWQPAGMMENNN